jgi:hypothetical protein
MLESLFDDDDELDLELLPLESQFVGDLDLHDEDDELDESDEIRPANSGNNVSRHLILSMVLGRGVWRFYTT